MSQYNLIIIGGGPAGMATAYSASQSGLNKILLIERLPKLGGILNQCIHEGFGLHYFKKELTGTEYSAKYSALLEGTSIEILTSSFVTGISDNNNVTYINSNGISTVSGRKIVLATGCRERTREMLTIPGTRPSGIYTAGLSQEMINIYGQLPGKRVVIVGSGDIGLIMARRLTLEGSAVIFLLEVRPTLAGLIRNKIQCLDDFNIPLLCNHELLEVYGKNRVSGIRYRDNTSHQEHYIDCDTLLFSVGLIPENDLLKATPSSICNGIRLIGNAEYVHGLVDEATKEAEKLGKEIAKELIL
ncbi:MAG: hypothetical protein A2Y40_07250 [Candidatus Margulisbacteria bacterium GWF2_35_9]|nr:MAG: hypothetical protein A2Y40_07250 [Candidatus Margulisbacteria bacterium GWF2_35_9]